MSDGELNVSIKRVSTSHSSIAIDWSNDPGAARVSVVKPGGRGERTLKDSSNQPLPTHLDDRHLSLGEHTYIITNWDSVDESGSSGQASITVELH
jgi:hypothetical protein